MNKATLAIPTRWQPAAFRIKQFVEGYGASHNLLFEVVLASEFDAGQIYIMDDSLTEFERLACQNAIAAVSTRVNSNLSKDAWQATHDFTNEQSKELEQISDLLDSVVAEHQSGISQPASGETNGES